MTEPMVTGCQTVVPGVTRTTRPSCSVTVPVRLSTLATMPVASTFVEGAIVAGVTDCTTTVPGATLGPEVVRIQPGSTSARRISRLPT